MKKVTIRKGWYWSAGHKYGWTKKEGKLAQAVGVDMALLKTNEKVVVRVMPKGETFIINCAEAIDFIRQYQSYKWIKEKCIGIVSKSILVPHETTS